jgi:alkylhydroperoxidase/carboxymuconolactone decarboxylase family protein YurZ
VTGADRPPDDLLAILSPEGLETLRRGYDQPFLLKAAQRMIPYHKMQRLTDWMLDVVYGAGADATSLSPRERELVLMGVIAAQRDTFVLAGRIYWGLMTGLSVENVADVLMTVAGYTGVNNVRLNVNVLTDVLQVLARAAATGGEAAATPAVLRELTKTFPKR